MRTALVGQRGVGKTSLLERIRTYHSALGNVVITFDLDKEIEKNEGKSIAEIFASGESAFREAEKKAFEKIDRETADLKENIYVACGAGFPPLEIPDSWRVLWIRRTTDSAGRIFMDRPRLDAKLTPLEEYFNRALSRRDSFSERADDILWLDEGIEKPETGERSFFIADVQKIGGALTLLPERLEAKGFKTWLTKRLNLGIRWIELRDDLLSLEQVTRALQSLPDERVLLSFRDWSHEPETSLHLEEMGVDFDWPIEWGACHHGDPAIWSLHEREPGQSIGDALRRFDSVDPTVGVFKAALPVENFTELKEAHEWWKQAPETRVFLPLSSDGRWTWYRLLMAKRQSFGFLRDGEGTGPDQPTLLQWIRRSKLIDRQEGSEEVFAAVLGDPVSHSRTPIEHSEYFAEKKASVFAIKIKEDEFDEAFKFLRELGLKWASVTAPLKEKAYTISTQKTPEAERLHSVNTLYLSDSTVIGANTDLPGFKDSISGLDLGTTAVWGGGGTLKMVKEVIPQAELFSVRTGENREARGPSAKAFSPNTVVWATGRSREPEMPPANWKPKLVIDLNYADDSPGREYALQQGCRYISGLAMFKSQAEYQRRFWETMK